MFRKFTLACLIAFLGQTATSLAAESDSSFALGFAPSYSEGSYGTNSTTNILYLPIYAKYQTGDLSLKLTVPYLVVEGTGGVVVSGGMVMGSRGPGGGRSNVTSGLGDIWAEARYRIHGSGAVPDFVPYAKYKFGTASYSSGLGTGQADYEGGLGLEWTIAKSWFPFLEGGYRVVGSPPGLTLNNITTYSAGVMYEASSQNFLTGMFTGHESAVPGGVAAADVIVSLSHQTASGKTRFQVFVDKGLSNGSPNFAAGVGVEKRF